MNIPNVKITRRRRERTGQRKPEAAQEEARRNTWLTMALSEGNKKTINRAAEILRLPPSTWGRAVLLREAEKVLVEEETSRR